jgi:hypothetical protein
MVIFTPRLLYSREKTPPGTPWIRDWMGHRTGLDWVAEGEKSCPSRESIPGRPVCRLVTMNLLRKLIFSIKVILFVRDTRTEVVFRI